MCFTSALSSAVHIAIEAEGGGWTVRIGSAELLTLKDCHDTLKIVVRNHRRGQVWDQRGGGGEGRSIAQTIAGVNAGVREFLWGFEVAPASISPPGTGGKAGVLRREALLSGSPRALRS
jgi:hypothetical protein